MKKTIAVLHKHILIISLILLALITRLSLITVPAFKIDMDAWVAWAYRLNESGFSSFYSPNIWTNYTPGYLYMLFIFGGISNMFQLTQASLELIIKLVSIFFEIALVLFIYTKASKKFTDNQKNLLSALLLFSPALIFNSTIWGQVDGILTFFIFISVYYLTKNQQQKSSLSYAYAFLVKPQSIALAPLFLIELIKNRMSKRNLKLIIPGMILFLLLSAPFFITDPLFGIFKLIFQMTEDYPATSLFAYNLWGIVGFWVNDLENNYRTIGNILFGTSILITLFLGLKKKANYFLLAALLTLFFYFLPTRVHERYLYPAIPFLFYSAFYFRSKLLGVATLFLSFTYAANLYYVYVYYNELFLKLDKVLYFEPLYSFLDTQGKLLSLFSTALFSIITVVIIKQIYAQKPDSKSNHKA